jgi:hypothetical protein
MLETWRTGFYRTDATDMKRMNSTIPAMSSPARNCG